MSTHNRRPRWWRRARRSDDDFQAEVRAHLELEADRLAAEGASPQEAAEAARRSFGSVLAAQERFYERSRWMLLDQLAQDVRYAWRVLRGSPAFVATTVLTLTVGIGLITVAFAILNAYVLRPLAVRDPYRLHAIGWRAQNSADDKFHWRDYEALRERHDLFDGTIAEVEQAVTFEGRRLTAAFVSGNYFDVLGVRMRQGRAIADFDARAPGGESVAVLTDQAWTRLYDRDPAVLGRTIHLNDRPFTIVGVAGPEFSGMDGSPCDLWLPLTMYQVVLQRPMFGAEQSRTLHVIARLRPGVTLEAAQSALTPLMAQMVGEGATNVRAEIQVRATATAWSIELVALLTPVFAAFLLVLIAACANVSNVMLARANARHREIGVRLSLGASRGRVVRQLVTEGLLIAALAGLGGLTVTAVALSGLMTVFVATLPSSVAALVRLVPLDVDVRVFLFAFLVAGAATILFALVPALQGTRLSLTDALRNQPSQGLRRSTLRNVLVACQVAVTVVLLIVAATLMRNDAALAEADLGFDPSGIISVNQRIGGGTLIPDAAAALEADARVAAVAVTGRNPLFGQLPKAPVKLPPPAPGILGASYNYVSPEYFPLLRIPILRGRGFSVDEARAEARVAVVGAATAAAIWPGRDPIGQRLRIAFPDESAMGPRGARERFGLRSTEDPNMWSELIVVGVAQDVVSEFVYLGRDAAIVYLPTHAQGKHAGALLARGRSARDARADTLQKALQTTSPDPQAFEVLPLVEMLALQIYPLRAATWIGFLLGALALSLSVSGLYGVLSYMLGQRTREIGIRMALGATSALVVRLVMLQSARVAGLGAALGVIVTFSVMKFLSAVVRLRNVSIYDPGAFVLGIVFVTIAVALAAFWPARRATRVDPSETLRADG